MQTVYHEVSKFLKHPRIKYGLIMTSDVDLRCYTKLISSVKMSSQSNVAFDIILRKVYYIKVFM